MTAREKFMAAAAKQAKERLFKPTPGPSQHTANKKTKEPREDRPTQAPIPDGYLSQGQIAKKYNRSMSCVAQVVRRGYVSSKPWGKYSIIAIQDWEKYMADTAVRRKEAAFRAHMVHMAKLRDKQLAKS